MNINKILENHKNDDFAKSFIQHQNIFLDIYKICNYNFNRKVGSYLFNGKSYEYYYGMYEKQKLLYDTCRNIEDALEIGTYMGHSLLIMLMSNPKIKVTCIDIDATYSEPATKFLQEKFPKAEIIFINANSTDILPKIKKTFDFFHIDGKHSNKMIEQEFEMCCNMSKDKEIKIIFDDSEFCMPLLEKIKLKFKILEKYTTSCEYRYTFVKLLKI